MKRPLVALAWIACLALVACTSGPPRRVSEPAASIQQLTVDANGNWSIDLRVQNYSSVAMRFDSVNLELSVGGEQAGTLQASPQLTISPASADVVAIALTPSAGARLLLADALASGRGVSYSLQGRLNAAPTDRGSARDYTIKREGALSPVPGLPGVLR